MELEEIPKSVPRLQRKIRRPLKISSKGQIWFLLPPEWGAGTGTGSAPVIARIARELGALTVAVVTKTFRFRTEKKNAPCGRRYRNLYKEVDTLITIPNENLMKIVEKNTPIREAFLKADDVLRMGVQGISDLIPSTGTLILTLRM